MERKLDNRKEESRSKISTDLEDVLKTRLIVNVNELAHLLELPKVTPEVKEAARVLPLRFPESLLNRVKKGDPRDPVLLQFWPSGQELEKRPGFSCDPLCEQKLLSSQRESTVPSCVMQKYAGRALVMTTNICACRCRFCFRRYFSQNPTLFPWREKADESSSAQEINAKTSSYFDRVFRTIRNDKSISEIIFSGGDPLTLSNGSLKTLLHYIRSIDHVKRVRFHSRVPILSPQRIDADFPSFDEFQYPEGATPLILHIALHVNAAQEIDENVAGALLRLRRKGYVLTSQSTLLRGVNDSVESLVKLYEKLINLGVIPYYLHQLDRVQGAAHFEVPVQEGREIVKKLGAYLPGYANPQYVRELPDHPMKVNLFTDADID